MSIPQLKLFLILVWSFLSLLLLANVFNANVAKVYTDQDRNQLNRLIERQLGGKPVVRTIWRNNKWQ